MNPAVTLQNHSFKNPILIIDRLGVLGKPLSLKLSKDFSVIFVSQADLDSKNQQIVRLPFFKKAPEMPDVRYSQIVFIDAEGQDSELLPKIVEKVRDSNAEFIFAQELSAARGRSVDKILQLYPSAKVVLVGDIFAKELIYDGQKFKSPVNKFIFQSQQFGKMQVLGEGLRETYPVFLEDVVGGIAELVSGVHGAKSLFYLFPKHPVTELSLAHMIQKANPEIALDFVRHESKSLRVIYPDGGVNLLGDKYPLAQRVRGIIIKRGVEIQRKNLVKKSNRFKHLPLFIIWVLIFLLFSPAVFTLLFSFLGKSVFDYAGKEIDRNNFANVKSSLHLSQAFFSAGKQTLGALNFQTEIIGKEGSLKPFAEELDLGYQLSKSLLQLFDSGDYFYKVADGKSIAPAVDFARGENDLKTSLVELNKTKAEGKIPAQISQKLGSIGPLIKLLSGASGVLSNIFGMDRQKAYLILLQNNQELRPGGGFIGSYAVLKINQGKVAEFSLHDTYDADSQLRGHVEPPFAIGRHLDEEHWNLRNSNFDVDFSQSAQEAANFLLVETGQKIDGVFAVDAAFLKNILHAVGPVYVSDFGETVDESNLYKLTQKYPEKNYFPGYTQKKDFLRSLSRTIIAKLSAEKVPVMLILQAVSDSIIQKHLLLSFNNNLQNIFTVNGWSSSLWDDRKEGAEKVSDFLGISEADLGINKVNYVIGRQVSQWVAVGGGGEIVEELVINYKNESLTVPGAEYKNYLRIILPKDTTLSGIEIDDVPQKIVDAVADPLIYRAKNFKIPQGLEVETSQENEKTIFGFLLSVPSEESVKVKLKYVLAKNVSGLNNFSYSLNFFKQPGVDNVPYSLSFVNPDGFNIINKSEGIVLGEDGAAYSKDVVKDEKITLDFVRK